MRQYKDKASTYLMSHLTELKFANDAGSFTGYGSTFGNIDEYGDLIQKGAYKKTLGEWRKSKKMPKMLVQHGYGESGLPIGKWTSMEEDDTGLKVEGQLFAPETELLKMIYMGMKAGELDGLSIGYRATEWVMGSKPGDPRRTLKQIALFEVSIVTFPANLQSRVNTVKAADIRTRRDFEKALRESGLFSRNDATELASRWTPKQGEPVDVVELLSVNPFA